MPKLIIQYDGKEWEVPLKDGPNVIGRSSKCGVPIKDTNISREHCEVVIMHGVPTLFDKGSMNGTIVNGTRVFEKKLERSDKITIGQCVIWFEEKRGDSPPPVPVAAAVAKKDVEESRRATSRHEVPVETARPGSSPKNPAVGAEPSAQKSTGSKHSAGAVIKDYAAWGSEGFNVLRVIPIVGGLLAVVVVAIVALKIAKRGPSTPDDPDNLIKNNASFELADEKGVPRSWRLRGGPKSRLALDASHARSGQTALVIDKSSEPVDTLVECEHGEEFALGTSGQVEASVWARSDSFGGSTALKITWLAKSKGPVILEEFSTPRGRAADWTQITETFTPPPGAGAFRFGIALFGRGGRALFDDARVAVKPGPGPKAPHRMGRHAVSISKDGAFQIEIQGKRIVTNAHVRLESNLYGVMPQLLSRQNAVTVEEKRIVVKGKLLNPVDFGEVDYEMTIVHGEDETFAIWSFKGSVLKQIDRVSIATNHIRAEKWQGLPEKEKQTSKVIFAVEELDLVLEYTELADVQADLDRSQTRLLQSFKVDQGATSVEVGIRIREISKDGVGELMDPERRASKELQNKNFGEALAILREYLKTVKEPDKVVALDDRIRRLEEEERLEWNEVRAKAFRGRLSRRGDELQSALDALDRYVKHWSGDPYFNKAEALRGEIAKAFQEAGTERDAERARRMLERAKEYRDAGRRALAVEFLQVVVALYGKTPAGVEALKLLEEIRSGG